MEDKRTERVGLVGLIVQLIFVGLCYVLASYTKSAAVHAEFWHVVGGVGIWLLLILHGRQRRLAVAEEKEYEELRRTRTSEELFEETELDTLRAKQALVFFERYLIPVFSIVVAAYLFFATWYSASRTWFGESEQIVNAAAGALGMVFITFVGFIIGKYAVGLAQHRSWRLLRAGGAYMMGNVVASLLITFGLALHHFGVQWAERVTVYLIPVLMGFVGFEIVLNLILDVYRPRVPGHESRTPYDSRLLGLVAEPGGILKTIADTLDYQFGFRVSETWFYKFMEKAIVPIILIQAIGLWLLTGLCFVKPDEGVFIERLGRPRLREADKAAGLKATLYGPGVHVKWPFPFERSRIVPLGRVMLLDLGRRKLSADEVGKEPPPSSEGEEIKIQQNPDVLLWQERHVDPQKEEEINLLTPSFEAQHMGGGEKPAAPGTDVPEINLMKVHIPVEYRIKGGGPGAVSPAAATAAWQWCYLHENPEDLLMNIAQREVCLYMSNRDMLAMISVERGQTSKDLRRLIQEAADRQQLGVEISYVGVAMVHPVPEAAKSFQEVCGAIEEMHAKVYEAEKKELSIIPGAQGEAAELRLGAEGERIRKTVVPKAEAELFKSQMQAYAKAPQSYLARKYYSMMVDVMRDKRKMIVPQLDDETVILDQTAKQGAFTDVKISGP